MTNPAPSRSTWTRTFTPVFTRNRHDGWTKQKQVGFINALAETGCVTDACRAVGMSTESAYALRRRYDAIDFRMSWDLALDYAVHRLADAALSRAIHGVAVPHYYKGEVVGEHRRYNETLTMFILRYRDPVIYARSRDRQNVNDIHPEVRSENLAVGIDCILGDESRKYCEANHRAEQAAADKEDDLKILEARREAAYQAYLRAEDAAKAAAAEAAAIAAAATAAAEESAANAAQAAPHPAADEHCAAALAAGGVEDALAPEASEGAAEAADIAGEIAATATDLPCAPNDGGAIERWQRYDAAEVQDARATDGSRTATGTAAGLAVAEGSPDGATESGGDAAFHRDVASGSSTSGDAPPPPSSTPSRTGGPAPASGGKWDTAAIIAAGYRIVTAAPPRQGYGPPYWAERIR
ncbi:hypothetical protein KZX46_16595 [Polymorphobacter sp. PAMC 29334]|uniref:hypothetical protein n=1 Tax=Polymorphobacter sp. PAMC 29334 TaxID=2862331 RepID=UPI001C74B141|nr:hypothetical protein [Polymorphobacter sp. PAMC 29334]QYE34383.1 hypothetical protein KZX46_16595 [Polymorphobacter sp. PAMC 29334]